MKWQNLDRSLRSLIEEYRKKSPYEVLNVEAGASIEEIRKSYLKMIKIYHTDKTGEFMRIVNEEISKIINNAYDTILRERNERR